MLDNLKYSAIALFVKPNWRFLCYFVEMNGVLLLKLPGGHNGRTGQTQDFGS